MTENGETEEEQIERLTAEALDGKKTQVIEVRHTGLGSKGSGEDTKKLKERLEQRENQLAVLALNEFSKKKKEILKVIPEDRKESVDEFIGEDPDKLESIRSNLILQGKLSEDSEEGDGTEAVPPAGVVNVRTERKSRIPKVWSREQRYSDPLINQISSLYSTIAPDSVATQKQKNEANKMIEDLFGQVREGLDQRGEDYRLPRKIVMTCSHCGKVVEKDVDRFPCPHCGAIGGKTQADRRAYAKMIEKYQR